MRHASQTNRDYWRRRKNWREAVIEEFVQGLGATLRDSPTYRATSKITFA
jgi:hypothetical protein